MRIVRRCFAAAFCALAVCACDTQEEQTADTELTEEQAQSSPSQSRDVLATGSFQPDAGSGGASIAGNYELVGDGSGGTELLVQVSGLQQGEHAWHIHASPCGTEGPVVVAFTPTADLQPVPNAQPLTADASGDATQRVRMSQEHWQMRHQDMQQGTGMKGMQHDTGSMPGTSGMAGQAHSIHVHARGGTDHGPTVACANLDLSRVHSTMMGGDSPTASPPQK